MNLHLPSLLVILFLLASCGGETKTTITAGNGPTGTQPMDHADDAHGEQKPLGSLTIGTHTFAVIQSGAIEAGKEGYLDLEFPSGKSLPGIVRAWVGVESGMGSMKGKLGKEGDRTLHGHVLVPKPIPEGSKIWIEIEEGSTTARGSIAWKP